MSGGLDSSYLLHLTVKEFGLRPLVFHVDGGWNSDIAVNNIEALVDALGLDLYTEVINWEEMRDFQLAFFKSGVPHLDVPQDHAFVATLYHFANKHGIRYILNGGNISTECVRNPLEWLLLRHRHGADQGHPPPLRDAAVEDLSLQQHLLPQGLSAVLRADPGRQAAQLHAVYEGSGNAGP